MPTKRSEQSAAGAQPTGVELILEAARLHGENSESEHEVGDLQDAIRLIWGILSVEQKRKVMNDRALQERIELEMGGDFDRNATMTAFEATLAFA